MRLLVTKGVSYISKKVVSKVFLLHFFVSQSAWRYCAEGSKLRFAVAGDERPEGFAWESGWLIRRRLPASLLPGAFLTALFDLTFL
jgi:hypothetical protein